QSLRLREAPWDPSCTASLIRSRVEKIGMSQATRIPSLASTRVRRWSRSGIHGAITLILKVCSVFRWIHLFLRMNGSHFRIWDINVREQQSAVSTQHSARTHSGLKDAVGWAWLDVQPVASMKTARLEFLQPSPSAVCEIGVRFPPSNRDLWRPAA